MQILTIKTVDGESCRTKQFRVASKLNHLYCQPVTFNSPGYRYSDNYPCPTFLPHISVFFFSYIGNTLNMTAQHLYERSVTLKVFESLICILFYYLCLCSECIF